MIPAKVFTVTDFSARYPHKHQTQSQQAGYDGSNDSITHESLLNDVPPAATSCLVYQDEDLKKYRPNPPVYSIPSDFDGYRRLKSLQAVFRTIPGVRNETIFSHIFVDPKDANEVLGDEIMECMQEVQNDVIAIDMASRLTLDHWSRRKRESFQQIHPVDTKP